MNKSIKRAMFLALCAATMVVTNEFASEKGRELEAPLLLTAHRDEDGGKKLSIDGDEKKDEVVTAKSDSVVVDLSAALEATKTAETVSLGEAKKGFWQSFKTGCSDCWGGLKGYCKLCWLWTPRAVKDSAEITELSSVVVGSAFIGNDPFAALLTGTATEQFAEITSRQKYYLKLIVEGAMLGGYKLLTVYTGFNIWTIGLGLLLCIVHTTLNDYAVATGRKNNFTQDFSNLPADLQALLIKKLKILARQVRAIKGGQHAMPEDSTEMHVLTSGADSVVLADG
jgi:hypothetical protein